MNAKQTKEYGVYLWDTFDNETLFLKDFHALKDAKEYIEEKFKNDISKDGANRVDIVTLSTGSVVKFYNIE